jgi:hypothetical protein
LLEGVPRLITTLEPPVAQNKPYQPYGAAEAMFYDRSHEVMLGGPADTGKSRAILEKLHLCAEKYPGMRGLICRKTRRACTESALVTFEQKVVPEGHPILNGPQREQRHSYKYPNGSELVIGGLDEITKILSSEWDMIYVQEAREASEDDWEHLCTRASGRAGGMPYSQVLGDTNPDAPRHWIKLRAARAKQAKHCTVAHEHDEQHCDRQLKLLESQHEDNPSITPERLAVLDALTGVRYKRLRLGKWVAAEGIVYEGYDRAVHIVDLRSLGSGVGLPSDWGRYLSIDFGYSNPLVAQWWAVDSDGRLYLYRELYRSQLLVEDAAHKIRELSEGETIRAIVCDHDAEDRATLSRHLQCLCPDVRDKPRIACGTTAARKDVSPGLQAVSQRLRPDGTGRPRLRLVRDALVRRDSSLDDRHLPCSTEEEFEGYIWDDATKKVNPDGSYKAEAPLKLNDHGMDAMRYMVAYFDLGPNFNTDAFTKPVPFDRGPGKGKSPDPPSMGPQFPARNKLDVSKFIRG